MRDYCVARRPRTGCSLYRSLNAKNNLPRGSSEHGNQGMVGGTYIPQKTQEYRRNHHRAHDGVRNFLVPHASNK